MRWSGRRGVVAPLLLALAGLLGACADLQPAYHTPNAHLAVLQEAGQSKLAAGTFSSAPGHERALNDLTIRGHSFAPPGKITFADYIRDAVISDLKLSDRYDPQSDLVLSGELQQNTIDGADFSQGQADIAMRFRLERRGTPVFEKVVAQHQQWPSSFIGAVAIPAAVQNYDGAVSELIARLFRDPEFRAASR
jgi:hypothetical protein